MEFEIVDRAQINLMQIGYLNAARLCGRCRKSIQIRTLTKSHRHYLWSHRAHLYCALFV